MYLHYDLFIILFEMTQVTASEYMEGGCLNEGRLIQVWL